MTKTDLPTPETLCKLLSYDPDTGLLTWKRRPIEMFANKNAFGTWNTRYSGKPAFRTVHSGGYRQGYIFNKKHLTHRIAYAIYHGTWPTDQIDHINGDKLDNRVANLRDVTHMENQRNTVIPINNTSGYIGVILMRGSGKWRSVIRVSGKKIHLGVFTDIKDAIAARAAAEVKYGFHANHGRQQSLA